jgi:hypothetical protein
VRPDPGETTCRGAALSSRGRGKPQRAAAVVWL